MIGEVLALTDYIMVNISVVSRLTVHSDHV